MKTTMRLSLITAAALLTACGGGGGGGGGDSAPAAADTSATASAATTETSAPEPAEAQQGDVTTAELLVERGYTLAQEFPLQVAVDPSEAQASYLSICTEFDADATTYGINYDSCLLRTAVDGPAAFELLVPNAVSELIAVRWPYDTSAEPVFTLWQRSVAGDSFNVN